jgi:GNAT superfamily N-acetyltransferase
VQIRAGQDDDRTFITEMARLACVIEDRPLPRPDAGEVIEMLPQTSDAVLVATDDTGNPIGATWWYFPQPPLLRATDGSPVPEMIVAVTKVERGHGIGTALIHALVAKAAGEFEQLALNVHIRNPAARLYSRTGFHVAGKGRGPLGVAMVKTLRQAP